MHIRETKCIGAITHLAIVWYNLCITWRIICAQCIQTVGRKTHSLVCQMGFLAEHVDGTLQLIILTSSLVRECNVLS